MNNNRPKWMLALAFASLSISQAWAQDYQYSLDECINIAYEKNLTIQRSELDLKVSEVTKNQSHLERLPDFNMGASYGVSWGRSIDPTTNNFTTQKNNSSNINGRSNLTVFNGMQIHNSIKQAEVNYAASEADLEKAKNDVGMNVATLYLNVIFNQELLANAEYQLNSTNQQLDRTKKMVDAGALPVTNLLDLQAQSASNEVNVINAENSYNLAILNLKQSLLIPSGDPFEIEVPELELQPSETALMTPDEIYKTSEGVMPEIESAELRIVEAELNYKISKGAYSPTLSVSAGFKTIYSSVANRPRDIYDGTVPDTVPIGYLPSTGEKVVSDVNVPNVVDTEDSFPVGEQFKENMEKNVGLNLTIPIFNKLRTRADVQRSMLSKYRAEVASQEVRNQLRQNIETAYNDMVAASKTHTANQKQVEALEEAFRVIENQFNLGAVNFVDYQVANNNLYMAKSDLVRAKFDFIFKQKILDFYLGKPITL
ncbi:TolC family protein [Reichenbachiella carrageenanivorans]|uniref:TolC family protein n=1 Tax=Reichenbachiella carrageenanivorans TaxID=2979869 RepID=A0ABY6CYK8_9BACT|nr:TolC family protein [Reichenbachiella carrageenanivorans]UXX78953.1 TolC family protein [Reichenbachiella carrageenanivorans]